jgi:hypothetical protein
MNTKTKMIKCKCCGKEVVCYFHREYCNKCKLFTQELRKKLSRYKRKYNQLKREMFYYVNS